jgi:4-amino-4-deoxy-L-arabinose transferase-like glycosyltransferase
MMRALDRLLWRRVFSQSRGTYGRAVVALFALVLLLVVPRIVALDADTLPSLSDNSGIWTDEGFYTYNARNAVLFGWAELDEFNNRLLSPILDAVQRVVFQTFGVSLVSARAISVVCALLALGFFYDALRRVWGRRVAVTGLVLLGGEVTFILYNRLALLETPSVLVLCAAFWTWTLAHPGGWLLAGALAASAIAFKTTFLIFLPVPLIVGAWRRLEGTPMASLRSPAFCYALGVLLGLLVYALTWGAPHGRDVWRYNNYYRTRQVQPRSVAQVARYAGRAVVGYRRSLAQFLETRTPVLTTLALIGLLSVPIRGRAEGLKSLAPKSDRPAGREMARRPAPTRPEDGRFLERGISIPRRDMPSRTTLRQDGYRVLWLWAVLGLVALAVSRYSPSRYYLIVYPPLAGLAALALWRLVPAWRWARTNRRSWRAAPLIVLPAFLLVYHLLLPGLNAWPGLSAHESRIGQALALAAALGVMYGALLRVRRLPRPAPLATVALTVFLLVSYGQWTHWFVNRGYRTRTVAREFAALVRPDEVLAGDWAPNLCLDNRVRACPFCRASPTGSALSKHWARIMCW